VLWVEGGVPLTKGDRIGVGCCGGSFSSASKCYLMIESGVNGWYSLNL
jgi:hypothetical protein